MRDSPCLGCDQHSSTCHADCKNYLQWRADKDKEKKRIDKEKLKTDMVVGYSADSARKVKKHSNKKRK
jgi:hypothetical protein